MEGVFIPLCFVLLPVFITVTDSQRIIFPTTVTLEEGDECRLNTGVSGRCTDIRICDYTSLDLRHNPPLRCGFEGIVPIICCSKNNTRNTLPGTTTDISQLLLTFQCGRDYESSEFFGEVTDKDDVVAFPWTVLVGNKQDGEVKWFCDGVLINEEWILMAAHCLKSNKPEVVRIGDDNFLDDFTKRHHEFSVAKSIIYQDDVNTETTHMLALLRLSKRIPIDDQSLIRPVCLPWGEDTHTDNTATLTTSGNTDFDGGQIPYIERDEVKMIPSSDCEAIYSTLPHHTQISEVINEAILCARESKAGGRTCEVFSGGSIVTQGEDGLFTLAGIGLAHTHSPQTNRCDKQYPTLYTNLHYQPYLTWIRNLAFQTYIETKNEHRI